MKKIRFSCYNIDNELEHGFSIVEKDYDDFVSWPEIVNQFNAFLVSCGYIPIKYNMFVEAVRDNDV